MRITLSCSSHILISCDIRPIKVPSKLKRTKAWKQHTNQAYMTKNIKSYLLVLIICSDTWVGNTMQCHMTQKQIGGLSSTLKQLRFTSIISHVSGNSLHNNPEHLTKPQIKSRAEPGEHNQLVHVSKKDRPTFRSTSRGCSACNSGVKSLWMPREGPKVGGGQRLSNYLRLILR